MLPIRIFITINAWQESFNRSWQTQFTELPGLSRLATGLGTEFMPELYEGDMMYMPTTLPGLSIGS